MSDTSKDAVSEVGAPTISANPQSSSTPKEETMQPSTSTDGSVPKSEVPAISAESTQPGKEEKMETKKEPAADATKPAGPAKKKNEAAEKKERVEPFNPAKPVKLGEDALTDAQGSTDSRVLEDVGKVEADITTLLLMPGRVAAAVNAAILARAAFSTPDTSLKTALDVVGGVLKATSGGRQFYANTKGNTVLERAQNVVDRLPEGDLGVPDELVTALKTALATATAAQKALDDALEARTEAVAAYTRAKTQLRLDVLSLRASLKAVERAQAAPVATSPTPPVKVPTPVGTTPVTATATPQAMNDHPNGMQHSA